MFVYEVVRENLQTGKHLPVTEMYYSNNRLCIDGLYMHLRNLDGAYRVLRLVAHFKDSREIDHNMKREHSVKDQSTPSPNHIVSNSTNHVK